MKKKAITLLLLLCMFVSLFSGMAFTVSAEEPVDAAQAEVAASALNELADEDNPADSADDAQAADKQCDF